MRNESSGSNRLASKLRRGAWFCLTLGIAVSAGKATAADSFVIIVNSANPVVSLSAGEVSDLFLKKTIVWPNGKGVSPIDLGEKFPAREAFSQYIHRRSTAAVRSLWLKMIFAGRSVPPPENESVEKAVAFVRAHREAIAYVPAGTPLGEGVKRLAIR